MECLLCNNPEAGAGRSIDHADFDCTDCGCYRVTGSVLAALDRGQSLQASVVREYIQKQCLEGIKRPLINTAAAKFHDKASA
jgi:hypothetical protein